MEDLPFSSSATFFLSNIWNDMGWWREDHVERNRAQQWKGDSFSVLMSIPRGDGRGREPHGNGLSEYCCRAAISL